MYDTTRKYYWKKLDGPFKIPNFNLTVVFRVYQSVNLER